MSRVVERTVRALFNQDLVKSENSEKSLKFSQRRIVARNYLNREAIHPYTQRLAGGDFFFRRSN